MSKGPSVVGVESHEEEEYFSRNIVAFEKDG